MSSNPATCTTSTELAKIYIDTYRKIAPQTHWDTFEVMYGSPVPTAAGGAVFLVFNLMKSLAETDKSIQDSDKFASELGASGMQKVSELTAASVEAIDHQPVRRSILVKATRPANGSKKIQASGKCNKQKTKPQASFRTSFTASSPWSLSTHRPKNDRNTYEVASIP